MHNLSKPHFLKTCCEEQLSPHNYILSADNIRFHLYLSDTSRFFSPGDSLSFAAKIIPLKRPIHSTDLFIYDRYLQQKGVFYRLYPLGNIQKNGHSTRFYFFFQRLRSRLLEKTDQLFPAPIPNALVKALCLGYKNDLDSETKLLFSETGTVHLLAVSGLHTGAVYLLLSFLFRILGFRHRYCQLLLIPALWAYACLSGLSPSVIRAAHILTFITIGQVFTKDQTPLNFIAASAFFTLLFQPYALYSISMQMSYAAYTGITFFYPIFSRVGSRLPAFLARIYALFCVTTAAQITTLPLSTFYFHSFSISSFFINILAVPFVTLLLYGSLLLLILPIGIGLYGAKCISAFYQLLVHLLHCFHIKSLFIENLYPSFYSVLFFYFFLLLFYLYLQKRKKRILHFLCYTIALFVIYLCYINWYLSHQSEIVIFHFYGKSGVLLNHRGYYHLLQEDADSSLFYRISPYILQHKLQAFPRHTGILCEGFTFSDSYIASRTQTLSFPRLSEKHRRPAQIYVIGNNLLPTQLFSKPGDFPSRIILDGSNHRFCIEAWERFCKEQNIFLQKTEDYGSIHISMKKKAKGRKTRNRL